jgi:hypothetical protein
LRNKLSAVVLLFLIVLLSQRAYLPSQQALVEETGLIALATENFWDQNGSQVVFYYYRSIESIDAESFGHLNYLLSKVVIISAEGEESEIDANRSSAETMNLWMKRFWEAIEILEAIPIKPLQEMFFKSLKGRQFALQLPVFLLKMGALCYLPAWK